jgi:flagella basal body P-ring formation protein FlgA
VLDLLKAGLIHSVLNCDELTTQNPELGIDEKICRAFTEQYLHVKLVPIKAVEKRLPSLNEIALGDINVGEPIAGRVRVSWAVKANNSAITNYIVTFTLDAYREIAVFRNKLDKYSVIEKGDVEYKLVNVAPYIGIKTFPKEDVFGSVVVKNVKKGDWVFADIISVKPLIQQNEEILVRVISGGLKLQLQAVALEAGFKLDQAIKVQIKETGAVLSAQVKGAGVADVKI